MNLLTVVLLALAQLGAVGGPTQVQDPAYPLRIRIFERNTRHNAREQLMWGRANIVSPQEQGFDYQSTCNELFMITRGDELYSARWKKPDKELEMLVSKMGTGKSEKCVLKADVKPFVYEIQNGKIVTKPKG